jgi:hypothetical protein
MEVITTNQLTTKFKRSKEKNEKKIERERERENLKLRILGVFVGI